MSFFRVFACDACEVMVPAKDEDDFPAGWLHLHVCTDECGGWNEANERHFCSMACLRRWTKKPDFDPEPS